jgi:cytoskeleton protein RodZ
MGGRQGRFDRLDATSRSPGAIATAAAAALRLTSAERSGVMIQINDAGWKGARGMAESDQDQLFGTPIGERLRLAREEQGVSLEDIAKQTRIPIRHLQHIERGEWDALPAATYSVGFARNYANAIGLDGPAIGAELREHLGIARRSSAGPAAYYEPADPARVPPRSIAIVAAILAVLLVVAYLVWRSDAVDDDGGGTPIVEAGAPAAAPATGPPAAAQPPQPATGPVVLTAAEEVWLRVYEAGGRKLYEGTLRAGERYEVPAAARAPQILTGRPNALRVNVGATAIPPLGPPERTIADVSLRPADLLARVQGRAGQTIPAPPPTPSQ